MSNSMISSSLNEKIFECDQHAAKIYEKLQKFYEEENFFDTFLIADDSNIKIPAHKIVLSALSEYFSEIFHGSCISSQTNEVKLEKIEGSSLKLIIAYMYSGSIELNLENIETLLRTAVFLKMETLIGGCCDFVERNLNNSNCLPWLRLAKELSLSGLQEKCLKFIYTHFGEVTKQPEFLLLNKIELMDLLFNDNHRGDLEEQVFLSMVTWIEYDKDDRQHGLPELLSMVRYQYLTPKFIFQNRSLVCKTVENCELVYGWLQYHMWPESRTIEQQNLPSSSEAERRKDVDLQEDQLSKVAFFSLNCKKEAEILSYNQTLEYWSVQKRSRPLCINQSEDGHSMIVIDEKIFLVGGTSDEKCLNSFECIDLKTFKLTDLPPMKITRYRSQLTTLNGQLCVFGGYKDVYCTKFIYSIEIFNFVTGKWIHLQPLFKPDIHSRIVGHNGILYIFNFRYGCVQCYDATSQQWTSKEQPIDDGIRDFQIVSDGNFVYALCIGPDYIDTNGRNKKTLLKFFDLSNNTWSEVAELTRNQSFIKMVTVIENKILFRKDNNNIVVYNIDTKEFILRNSCLRGFPFKL